MPRINSNATVCGRHHVFLIPKNCVAPELRNAAQLSQKPALHALVQAKITPAQNGDSIKLSLQTPKFAVGDRIDAPANHLVYEPRSLKATLEFAQEHRIPVPCMTQYVVSGRTEEQVLLGTDPEIKQKLQAATRAGYDVHLQYALRPRTGFDTSEFIRPNANAAPVNSFATAASTLVPIRA